MNYFDFVRSYPDFPQKGILFWDFSYLVKDVAARDAAVADIKEFLSGKNIDKIAAIESKGFILGAILAHELKLPLVLIRKPGLTPGRFHSEQFVKEYGIGEYHIKTDAVTRNERVAVVYDIMAGSGASIAAINLIQKAGAQVPALVYATELAYLGGRKELEGHAIFSLVKIGTRDDTVS